MSSRSNSPSNPLSHPIYAPLPSESSSSSSSKKKQHHPTLHDTLSALLHPTSSSSTIQNYSKDLEHKLGYRSIRLEPERTTKKYAYNRGDRGGVKRNHKKTSQKSQKSQPTSKPSPLIIPSSTLKTLKKTYTLYLLSLPSPSPLTLLLLPGATVLNKKERPFIITRVEDGVVSGAPKGGGRERRVEGNVLEVEGRRVMF